MKKYVSIFCILFLVTIISSCAKSDNDVMYADEEIATYRVIENREIAGMINQVSETEDDIEKINLYDKLWEMTVINDVYDNNITFEKDIDTYMLLLHRNNMREILYDRLDVIFDIDTFDQEAKHNTMTQLFFLYSEEEVEDLQFLVGKLVSLYKNDERYKDKTIYTSHLLVNIMKIYSVLGDENNVNKYDLIHDDIFSE